MYRIRLELLEDDDTSKPLSNDQKMKTMFRDDLSIAIQYNHWK